MADQMTKHNENAGLPNTWTNSAYQVKLSVLLFIRAMKKDYKFQIAAKRQDTCKFEDLNIELSSSNDHRIYMLKQQKDETKNKITSDDLNSPTDGEFSLSKYFISYRKIKENIKSNGMSHELVVFTNIALEKKLRKNFETTDADEILNMKIVSDKKKSERLKLKATCKLRRNLKRLLKKTSEIEQIKIMLIDCIKNGKDIDFKDITLKKYQYELIKTVLNEDGKKFTHEFLNKNSNLTDVAKELQLFLLEKFGNSLFKLKMHFNFPNNGTKTESKFSNLPNDKIADEEISEFLDCLVFAVNQPNENELNAIIEETMGEDRFFNLLDNGFVADEILGQMMEWTKLEKDTQKGEELLEQIRQIISKLLVTKTTEDFCKQLESFGISFHDSTAGLEQFLETSSFQIFHLVNSFKSVFSSIKVHHTLKTLKQYHKEGSYMFSSLDNLQRIRKRVLEAFELCDLLVVEFSTSDDEIDDTFVSDILKVLRNNRLKKLVLISNGCNRLRAFLENIFLVIQDDSNSFNDLTKECQEQLLSTKEVSFQGHPSLIDWDLKHFIDADILFRLISSQGLEIGSKLPNFDETERHIVPRKFRKIQISDSILEATEFTITYDSLVLDARHDQDIILISEAGQVYESMCKELRDNTIHWIKKEQDIYVWKKSNGSNLSRLRKYLVLNSADATNLSEMKNKVVIIADQPGAGKTTELTRIAKEFKALDPSYWILRVNLIDSSTIFAKQSHTFDQTDTLQFLYELLDSAPEENIRLLEKEWFLECFEQSKVKILFDGFDEISPHYKDKAIEMLKALKYTKVTQLWIATRTYGVCTELEDQLQTLSYSLKPLEHNDKKEILVNILTGSLEHELARKNADELLLRCSASKNNTNREFLNNPLEIKMVATVFLDSVDSNDTSLQSYLLTDSMGEIDLAYLYQKFFDVLFDDVYIKEKNPGFNDQKDEPISVKVIEEQRKKIEESYKMMALYTLFGTKEFEKLMPEGFNELQTRIDEIDKSGHNLGIVVGVVDSQPMFVHRTYAEFFSALYLTAEHTWSNLYFQKFMTKLVFLNHELTIARFFVFLLAKNENYKSNFPIHVAVFCNDESTLKRRLTNINDVKVRDTLLDWNPLQYAALCGFWSIIELLLQMGADKEYMLEIIQANANPEHILHLAVSKNLLNMTKVLCALNASYYKGETSLYLAIAYDSLDVMKYLLDKCEGSYGQSKESTAFFVAVNRGALRVVQYLLETEKVDINVKDKNDQTPLLLAVEKGILNIVEYLVMVESVDLNIRDKHKRNLLQIAVEPGHLSILKCLVSTGKFNARVTDEDEETLIHLAIRRCSNNVVNFNRSSFDQPIEKTLGCLNVVTYLVDVANVDLNIQNRRGLTALHLAILMKCLDVVKYLISLPQVSKDKQDNTGLTALHLAVRNGQLDIVKMLIEETTTNVSLEKMNNDEHTPLHLAVLSGELELVKYLVGTIKSDICARDKYGNNLLQLAIESGSSEVFEYLVSTHKFNHELQFHGDQYLKNACINGSLEITRFMIENANVSVNTIDSNGKTLLHLAARSGSLRLVDYLLSTRKIDRLATDNDGKTILHSAIHNLAVVKYLLKSKVDANAKDKYGQTTLHLAIENNCEDVAEYLIMLPEVSKTVPDNNGRTALQMAIKADQLNVVRYLIESSKPKKPVWFDVEEPVLAYVSRQNMLNEIAEKLKNGIVVISGMSGMGKSELARKYAQDYSKYYNSNVIWINAENQETIKDSCFRLAKGNLKIKIKSEDGEEKPIDCIVKEVYDYFGNERSLIILDSADSLVSVKPFFLTLSTRLNKPDILITSQNNTEWISDSLQIWQLPLHNFTDDEGRQYVKNVLKVQDESQNQVIDEFVKKLFNVPLALNLALVYIKDKQKYADYTVKNFIEEFEEAQEKLREEKFIDAVFSTLVGLLGKMTLESRKSSEKTLKSKESCRFLEVVKDLDKFSIVKYDGGKALMLSSFNQKMCRFMLEERKNEFLEILILSKNPVPWHPLEFFMWNQDNIYQFSETFIEKMLANISYQIASSSNRKFLKRNFYMIERELTDGLKKILCIDVEFGIFLILHVFSNNDPRMLKFLDKKTV